jgi:hypothetical protein
VQERRCKLETTTRRRLEVKRLAVERDRFLPLAHRQTELSEQNKNLRIQLSRRGCDRDRIAARHCIRLFADQRLQITGRSARSRRRPGALPGRSLDRLRLGLPGGLREGDRSGQEKQTERNADV